MSSWLRCEDEATNQGATAAHRLKYLSVPNSRKLLGMLLPLLPHGWRATHVFYRGPGELFTDNFHSLPGIRMVQILSLTHNDQLTAGGLQL